jgi:hypothetical protein
MKLFLVVFGLGFALLAVAADTDPKPDMHSMAAEITILQKFLLSDAEFGMPANDQAIKNSLATINEHLGHLGEGKTAFSGDPALKVNLSMLQQHIKDAERSFREGNKPFAKYMIQSSLQMCIACHTRKKTNDFVWPDIDAKNIPNMEKADYYFATRQFFKGKAIYENMVEGYPANKLNQWDLRRALLSLAVYYARITEDPAGGESYFKKAVAGKNLPVYVTEEVSAWSKEFGAWSKEPKPKVENLTESALLAQAKKLLRHDDFSLTSEVGQSFHVRRLRASTILQRVLEAPGEKSPQKATALLYLGQIYSRISSSLFFRFGEMYLKACVNEYPKSAMGRSCYVALESVVSEGYTGSGGTNIPDEDQIELMRLKRLAY